MKPKVASRLTALLTLTTTLSYLVTSGRAETNLVLEIFPAFEIEYDTETGSIYQLQGTTNLTTWTNVSLPRIADGTSANHFVSTRDLPQQTFRVLVVSGDGLVAHYPLNGDAADSSTNANDGVLMTPSATTNRLGSTASALSFNGSSDNVAVPDAPQLNFTNTLSFSVWAKFLLGGTHNPRVFHKDENFTGYQLYTPGLASGRQFNFTVYLEGVGYVSVESTGGYSSGVWHHIAGTFDGVELKLYVNGMLVGTTAAVGSIAQTDVPLAIGRNSNQATDHWRGDIDELRLYNRALSEEEVAVLYLLQQ